jgi:hypothetical protein
MGTKARLVLPSPLTLALAWGLRAVAAEAQPTLDPPPLLGERWTDFDHPGWAAVRVHLDPALMGADGVSVALVLATGDRLTTPQVCASGRVVGELPRSLLAASPRNDLRASLTLDAEQSVYRRGAWALCARTAAGAWRPGHTLEALPSPGSRGFYSPTVELPSGTIFEHNLRVGATILSWDPIRNALVQERLRASRRLPDMTGVRLRLSDGQSVYLPARRLVWVEREHTVRPAELIADGDRLRARDGHDVVVVEVTRRQEVNDHLAYSITGSGLYFHDGLLVADAPLGVSMGAPFVEAPSAASITVQNTSPECSISLSISPRTALPAGVTDVDVVLARHAGPMGVPRPMSCGQGRVVNSVPRALWDPLAIGAWASADVHPTIHLDASDPTIRCDYRRPPPLDYDVLLCGRAPGGRRVALSRVATFAQAAPTCLAEGTLIATVDGPVAIESLTPGQRLAGWDTSAGRAVETRVVGLLARGDRPVAVITLDDGTTLRATAEHPFWSADERRWRLASELTPGMTLTRTDGTTVAVRSRGTFDGSARVFDLSVTAPHDYFANGVLVHNY